MSEYIVELDSKHNIALKIAFAEEMRGGDFVRGEIVRCRDCKHWATEARFFGMCVGKRFDPDGFCKWASRKEVDE